MNWTVLDVRECPQRNSQVTNFGIHVLMDTGEKLDLPDATDSLKFSIGIEGAPLNVNAPGDGVRLLVKVRNLETRELETVFDEVETYYRWCPGEFTVDLSDYAGKTVDLIFEVHGRTDSLDDRSVWGMPRIVTL